MLWDLISKRILGQNVVGTFIFWDKMLLGHLAFGTKCSLDFWHLEQFTFFGTHMHWDKRYWDKMSLGQFTCGQKGFGTILLGSIIFGTKGIGKIT